VRRLVAAPEPTLTLTLDPVAIADHAARRACDTLDADDGSPDHLTTLADALDAYTLAREDEFVRNRHRLRFRPWLDR
jgi:hypothetical protein